MTENLLTGMLIHKIHKQLHLSVHGGGGGGVGCEINNARIIVLSSDHSCKKYMYSGSICTL